MNIEDLKEEKQFYKREKDVFGNVVRTPYTRMIPREVNTVTQGVRFGYYLIDLLIIFLIEIAIWIALEVIFRGTNNTQLLEKNSLFFILYSSFSRLIIYFLYYMLSEGYFSTTIGKAICGYTTIDENANRISFSTGILRSLCRFIPFEAFSCLSERGWHDRFTKTYVVKKGEKTQLQILLKTVSDTDGQILG